MNSVTTPAPHETIEKNLSWTLRAALAIFAVNHTETFKFLGISAALAKLILSPFMLIPGLYFTATLLELDRKVRSLGFAKAMSWAHRRYYAPTETVGWERAVKSGPVVLVSNHPGLGDFTAIMETVARDDVRVIVKRRELMRDLGNILDRCIVIDANLASRARAVVQAIRHLSEGGLLIVFPAGEIEEDPALARSLDDKQRPFLKSWYPIVDGIARRCSKLGLTIAVQPVLTDRVYHVPRWLSPLIFVSDDPAIRSGRAAIATMVAGMFAKRGVRVSFAPPIVISPGSQATEAAGPDALTAASRRALLKLACRPA